ncbi:hypothetical protein SG34_012795 [Thalassomonas viridans]|uniref:Uncharacterized protein n=1 Tax=Thalassomonas viridans TaxID=137584 RepID=A0AAE9Z7R3_9GAMM|nr:hypothetical protein [Thalassomonas viridans]WDE07689.1 hypothetical protein SG34_012795 [Thalassomonas viridans]
MTAKISKGFNLQRFNNSLEPLEQALKEKQQSPGHLVLLTHALTDLHQQLDVLQQQVFTPENPG